MIEFLAFKPIEFYPYAHCVQDRIITFERDYDQYDNVRRLLVQKFKQAGLPAHEDNKTAFKLLSRSGFDLYVGFYDNVMAIGMSCRKVY